MRAPQLQMLRAIAAIAVLAHHANERFAPQANVLAFGQYGVDLFFVLSGFVIQLAHGRDVGQPAALPNYLRRRFARIYPPYLLASAVFLPLALYRWPQSVTGRSLIASALILPDSYHVLQVAWTLTHEVKFYLAFAVLIVLPRLLGALLFAAVLVVSAAAWIEGAETFFLTSFNLEFAAGVGACRLVQRGIPPSVGTLLGLAGVCLFIVALTGDSSRFIAVGIPATLIVLGALATPIRARPLERIGDASYMLYLIHYPLLVLADAVLRHAGLSHLALAYAAIAGLIAAVSVLISERIEMPAVRFTQLTLQKLG